MANIAFKRGLHAALPATAVDGCFYLTTDTNRLYVGQGTSMVELNKSITEVAQVEDLPKSGVADGQFYYATKENVLCIYKDSKWVQINPDTDTNDTIEVTGMTVTTSGAENAVEVKGTISQKKTAKDGSVVTGPKDVSVTGPKVTGAAGATVTQAAGTITVTGDTYSKAEAAQETEGQITLKSALGQADIVVAKQGTNVTIATDGKISSKNTVIKATTAEEEKVTATAGGEYVISTSDTDNNTSTRRITPKIKLEDEEGVIVFNQDVATLPVYSKDAIDKKLNGLDAMTYKGTVGTGGTSTALPTTGVKAGDTYLVVGDQAVTGSGKNGKAGDLFIATGTETNGVIPADGITWTYVPSGDDSQIDTTYTVNATDNLLTINDSHANVVGKIIYDDKKDIIGTPEEEGKAIRVAHKNVSRVDPELVTAEGKVTSVTAVTNVTTSNTGHVTGVEKTEFNLQDLDTTYTLSGENSVAKNKSTFKVALKDKVNNDAGHATFEVESQNLTLSSKANGIGIDLVWGTF